MHTQQGQDKIWQIIIVLVIAIIISIHVFARESDSICYSFSQTDTTYSFYGRFEVVAEAACVIHICFDYEHIKALALDASKVELIEEGEDWNEIKYTYQQFPFYKNESLWHRTIDREGTSVYFTLISSKNNHSYMPRMISSSGYYKVSRLEGVLVVEYFQQCRLTKGFLSTLYQYSMKKKAVEFLHVFKNYSQTHCKSSD